MHKTRKQPPVGALISLMSILITLITEDSLSETVMRKMLEQTNRGYGVTSALSWNKDKIRKRINGINQSARGGVYLVLTDQDTDQRCPPDARKELQEAVHPNLIYRFAVMEVESWIMAHRDAISDFLSVPVERIPGNTDEIPQPKEYLVGLARKSRSGRIRKDIAPRKNSTSKVGPDYNAALREFVLKHWDVTTAMRYSPSLGRAYRRLESFTQVS